MDQHITDQLSCLFLEDTYTYDTAVTRITRAAREIVTRWNEKLAEDKPVLSRILSEHDALPAARLQHTPLGDAVIHDVKSRAQTLLRDYRAVENAAVRRAADTKARSHGLERSKTKEKSKEKGKEKEKDGASDGC
jgi:hypothetical protein